MKPFPSVIAPLIHKPVAIFGYGVSGQGVADVLRRYGVGYVVYDERGGADVVEAFTAERAGQHDLVVYSPGFAVNHPWLRTAVAVGCALLAELDFAALFWGGKLIAVTGTNGKTTLTELLTLALQRQGILTRSVGNIGYPLSRLVAEEMTGLEGNIIEQEREHEQEREQESVCVVCEVSSFQAEHLQHFSPDAVLWTNFAEDHLDRHGDMEHYFSAKWRLVERLRHPKLVVGQSVAQWAERVGKALLKCAVVVDRDVQLDEVPVGCSLDNYPQRENFLLALRFWQLEGYDMAVLAAAAQEFSLAKHRLERLGAIGDVSFWNDSKATNFAATLAALKTFAEPVYWIGGGKKKGGDIRGFAHQVAGQIEAAFLIGESATEMQSYLVQHKIFATTFKSIDAALMAAFEQTAGRAAIVLSPGFSSQDQFTDYVERGVCFANAVSSLQHHHLN